MMEHYWTGSALEHNAQVYTCARDLQEDLGVLLAYLPQTHSSTLRRLRSQNK